MIVEEALILDHYGGRHVGQLGLFFRRELFDGYDDDSKKIFKAYKVLSGVNDRRVRIIKHMKTVQHMLHDAGIFYQYGNIWSEGDISVVSAGEGRVMVITTRSFLRLSL